MIEKKIKNITEAMAIHGIIAYEDEELYIYGMMQGLIMIFNIATTIVIGLLLGMVWQSLLLMISYIPLRTYAGGYHARTQIKCYVLSVFLVIGMLLLVKFSSEWNYILPMLSCISGGVIFLLAPLEDVNKPLDAIQKSKYRKTARIILLIELCVAGLSFLLESYQLSLCISTSIVCVSVLLMVSKLLK